MTKEELRKHTARYIGTWLTFSCPHCGKKNWMNDGDVRDLTVMDLDDYGWTCWSCEKNFILEPDEIEMQIEGIEHFVDLLNSRCNKGRNMQEADLQKSVERAETKDLDELAKRMEGRLRAVVYCEDLFPGASTEALDSQARNMATLLMYDLAGKP